MSEFDEILAGVDQDEQMIKYLRDRITGRPAVFSRVGDLPIEDPSTSIKKSDSQNSLTDLSSIDQVERTNNTSGSRRLLTSSSPIIIPKKPPRSNASSQSSSSYTSLADPIPPIADAEDASNGLFPAFPLTCQRLEHSAARDRISVKSKRRQPTKEKLSTLREADDDLFSSKVEVLSSTPDDEPTPPRLEVKPSQPLLDLSDLDTARSRLRMSVRPRDRSADNILTSPITPKPPSSMQRSMSFKRPPKTDLFTRLNEEPPSRSRSSSQEHIYDNLDVFKRSKVANENEPSVKARESTRLRPVTMYPSTTNEEELSNEFENVFNQLKRRASIRSSTTEEKKIEAEPVAVQAPSPQPANRRRTVASVHLPATNKVATEEAQPTPSWVDIAKQKQSKFQSTSNEAEPMIVTRKPTPTADQRANRKSMFESSALPNNPPPIERDSIRALKAGNPNRINNLIQFFDK